MRWLSNFSALAGLVIILTPAASQTWMGISNRAGDTLTRGRIEGKGVAGLAQLRVELSPIGGRVDHRTAHVMSSGDFVFQGVRPGPYRLEVLNRVGISIYSCPVNIRGPGATLDIKLPNSGNGPAVTGAISAARLRHRVPRRAAKGLRRAAAADRKGDRDASILHVERAVEIDPDYFQAQLSLGTLLLKRGNTEQSLAHLGKATRLDPGSARAFSLASVALFTARKYREAAVTAGRAVRLDGRSEQSRMVLGLCQLRSGADLEAAVANLRQAVVSFPEAHVAAAQASILLGQLEEARAELEAYLLTPAPARAKEVRQWLERLAPGRGARTGDRLAVSSPPARCALTAASFETALQVT